MRYKIIRKIISILVVFTIIFTVCFTYFISPNDYKISNYSYINSKIPSAFNNFKIAFISDCNIRNKDDINRLKDMITKVNKENIDMAVFTGDLFDQDVVNNKDLSSALKSIDALYGKFAVLGEKDSSTIEIEDILNNGGFEVLDNNVRTIYYNDKTISLVGLNYKSNAKKVVKSNKLFTIALTHHPDSFDNNYKYVDLQLSGHSNGGYLYIPIIGSLITSNGCKTYNHGEYTKDSSTLLVSNGVRGTSNFPYKLFSRNEINIIILNSSSN